MRVVTANGALLGDTLAEIFVAADPTIAAITSLSPSDACALASQFSLRYAVQSWDAPEAGKALFWKPVVALRGLYRVEFRMRDPQNFRPDRRGLLRATLVWDGSPLHVYCSELSRDPHEADWQMVQIARELDATRGATIFALDPGAARLPAWSTLSDTSSTARWRSIAYPRGFDVGDAARAAFGLSPALVAAAGQEIFETAAVAPVRLLCSDEFSVVRVRQRAAVGAALGCPLVVDLAPAADEDCESSVNGPGEQARTGTYPA